MRKTNDFRDLTRRQISEICGKTERTITNWVADGCPRKPNNRFSSPDVIKWLINKEINAVDTDSPALERYRTARAKLVELDLEHKRGKFVEKELMEIELAKRASFLKNDLTNFIYSRTPEMVAICHGDQQYSPDAIDFWLKNLEVFLGRYAK